MTSTQFIETRSLRIHYRQAGVGIPVLFLHGFPETSYAWRFQLEALGEEYACFAPDLRGFGETDKPGVRVTRALLAEDVISFLDALGLEQVAVVGHDWGGIVAFKLAIDWPQRVSCLALLDSLCTVWSRTALHGYWFKASPHPEEFFARHHREFIAPVLCGGEIPPMWPGPPQSPWREALAGRRSRAWATPEDLDHYRRAFADPMTHVHAISYYRDGLPFHIVRQDPRHHHGERFEFLGERDIAEIWLHTEGYEHHPNYRHYFDFGPEDRCKQFLKPTLWLHSTGDPGRASRVSGDTPYTAQFARYFPNLWVRQIPAGHFFPEETPKVTSEALIAFLADCRSSGPSERQNRPGPIGMI